MEREKKIWLGSREGENGEGRLERGWKGSKEHGVRGRGRVA